MFEARTALGGGRGGLRDRRHHGFYHSDDLTSAAREVSDCEKVTFLGEVETVIKPGFAVMGSK